MKTAFQLVIAVIILSLYSSCKNKIENAKAVTDSIQNMMTHIAGDISAKGPIGWLGYFENSPAFFMASDGQKVLKDYPTAVTFVKDTLVKALPHITLQWQHISVDPINENFASIGADFHEGLTFEKGVSTPDDGYFTAIAHFDGHQWKLRNLHWSSRPPIKNGR